jgi:ribosomal protein S11
MERLSEIILYLTKANESNNRKLITKNLNLKNRNFDCNSQQKMIRYIINIKFTASNTLVNVTDIEGNPKVFLSSGVVGLKGKMKKYHPTAIVKILKFLVSKIKFVGASPVAIHFIGAKRYQILLAIKLLKTKVFIKTIRNYNLKAYNGCRPRKMKRLKY